jgi:hypothetical protein
MHTLTVLLFATAAATATPTPIPAAATVTSAATPTPTPILTPVNAATGQTRTLADVARERKLGKKGVQGGTLSVAGAPVPQSATASGVAKTGAGAGATASTEEVEWRRRYADARAELSAAQAALEKADLAMPAVVTYGRPGAAHAIANEAREGALLPYRMRVSEAQAKVDALPEEARKVGASPGWVREGR